MVCMVLGKLPKFSMSQFPLLQNQDNYTSSYLTRLVLNQTMHIKHLAQNLAQNKHPTLFPLWHSPSTFFPAKLQPQIISHHSLQSIYYQLAVLRKKQICYSQLGIQVFCLLYASVPPPPPHYTTTHFACLKKFKDKQSDIRIQQQLHMPQFLTKILAWTKNPQRRKSLETRNSYQMSTGRHSWEENQNKTKQLLLL